MRALKGRDVKRILEAAGFAVVRSNGSHFIMKREGQDGTASVPIHGGKDIKLGTLRGIIRSAGLTLEEFWSFDQ